jgi:hypothetical protein
MTPQPRPGWRNGRRWAGVLVGPSVFLLDLEARYALVPPSRIVKHMLPIHLVSLTSLAIVAAAMLGSYRELRATRNGREVERRAFGERFLAILGLCMSAFFLLVIIVNALPSFFLTPED